ncbi:hypothetical protein GCM10011391_12440 [Pullulanibacillus camelliae]|uniref:Uncharacterized protein n=1 Tax=Pullulanibacillus camelliae TaxID=1707096 RepID=A0A8J2YFW7_9BACL|nr:hypothetical protein GCM10011391_12440 [Pullulanibacillus camelliae]
MIEQYKPNSFFRLFEDESISSSYPFHYLRLAQTTLMCDPKNQEIRGSFKLIQRK